MHSSPIPIDCLGQSGFRFQFDTLSVFIDPYLSDRVATLFGTDLRRLLPPPFAPHESPKADWILITHGHEDHCDPETVLPLCERYPQAKLLCPAEVSRYLTTLGIDSGRIVEAARGWFILSEHTRVHVMPAAHTEPSHDEQGKLRCVGYVIDHNGRRIYHSGDTSPDTILLQALREVTPIQVAFLPVNERNFYRRQRGIIGNMSVREAFEMAVDLGVDTMVPMHWDLFAPNSVFREELVLLYDLLRPPFRMILNPTEI